MNNFHTKSDAAPHGVVARGGGEEETVRLPGRDIVVRRGGEGPPLVYLHSALGEGSLWLPFMHKWSKSYNVFVPLHPGFGGSDGFDRVRVIDDMAFHYAELFAALGLDEFILGGHSLGGWIAAEFAVRWPERVRALFVSGAPGLWVDDQPLPDLFRHSHDRKAMRDLLFFEPDGGIAGLVMGGQPNEEQLKLGFQAMTVLARLMWERPYDPRLAERLYRIACPTLLLWGENDRLVPPAYGEAYRRHVPHAVFELLPKCGHLPMFENERGYVDRVMRFLKESSV